MRAIDLFSGWGGFSLGATMAGVEVVWAGNHWPLAVEAHRGNHPEAQHVCQDLRQQDWTALPGFDLLLASPACQPHSTASQPGRRAKHDAERATAWAVVDCADATEPHAIVVENVPAFARWRLFPLWCDALRALGYRIDARVIRASYHGVPQRRDRLFITATRKAVELDLDPKEEPAFGPCVEWDAGPWRPVAQASPNARSRIATAQRANGPRCLSQHTTGHPGVNLSEPIRTITTKDQWVVVDGDRYRPLTVRETARAMGFPDTYGWPAHASRQDTIKGLGNAVAPPVARHVIERVVA